MSRGRAAAVPYTALQAQLGALLEERIRAIVREELESVEQDEWVTQTTSPIPRKSFLKLVREGKLPGRKVGKQVLVRRKDLEAFIDAQRVARRADNDGAVDTGDEFDAALAKLGFTDRGH